MKRLRFANFVSLFIVTALLLVMPSRGTGANPSTAAAPPVDLSQLRDITGIERHDAETSAESVPWWSWLLLGVIPFAGVAAWLWRRRRNQKPPPAPEEWALTEIARVEALRLPEAGALERFHTLLSDVLRRYLELRYQLPASRQTTAEFLQAATTSIGLPQAQRELATAFLEQCDLAKFARAEFSAEECQKALVLARTLVRQCEAHITNPTHSSMNAGL